MIKYFIILIMLFNNNAFASEPLKIELESLNDELRLYLMSLSYKSFLINKTFSFGAPNEKSQVTFEIFNKEGNNLPFAATVD